MSVCAALFVIQCGVTFQVLKHIVNTSAVSTEGGKEERAENRRLLKIYLTAIHLLLLCHLLPLSVFLFLNLSNAHFEKTLFTASIDCPFKNWQVLARFPLLDGGLAAVNCIQFKEVTQQSV